MPDHIDPIAAEGQADWPAMMHDLEKKVEVLSDALEAVKLAMRRLVMAEPWIEQAIEAVSPAHGPAHFETQPAFPSRDTHPAYELPEPANEVTPQYQYETPPSYPDTAAVYNDAPSAYHETPPSNEAPPHYEQAPSNYFDEPKYEPPAAPAMEPSPAAYDEDAREAVRRAVEEAKAQMASGDWHEGQEDFVDTNAPAASWTISEEASEPQPSPVFDEPAQAPQGEQTPESDEDVREAVRRAVEQAKAELNRLDNQAPPVDATQEQPAAPASDDDEAAREAVRQAVEAAKAELSRYDQAHATETVQDQAAPPDYNDDDAAREAVRQAVEQAKAERAFAENAIGTLSQEEAAREAVRQAVLKARTEMATTGSISEQEPEPVVREPAFVVPPPHRPERVHPPTLTIEDPEGRVELARVYNLLKHLDVAANSSLLNYSSRQVSVQLSDNKTPPDDSEVAAAVRSVFERDSDVSADGLNVIVKLGSDQARAA